VRSIAVIQAGTGVGKSLAYTAPAVALALARNTRVMISTATVALQEQLVNKDLPALAAAMPQPFRFALAKGRGRYVCKLKLDRLLARADLAGDPHDDDPHDDDLLAEADLFAAQAGQARGRWGRAPGRVHPHGARIAEWHMERRPRQPERAA
jgi:ATP-dependent DNA helicase DinG